MDAWPPRRGAWSFCRTQESRSGTRGAYRGWDGTRHSGINFAAQDYLGLSHHPRVIQAAHDAIEQYGLHGAGSEVNGGTTWPVEQIALRLARLLNLEHCIMFPTGWAAGYAAIRGLMRRSDVVVIDKLAHNCLREGALASGAEMAAFDHNDPESLAAALERARSSNPDAAILVVIESLYSMDSDGPNLRGIIDAARAYGAHTLVDCAHDLGVFGKSGAGLMADAGVLGEVDFVVGSFSKVFATTGGFLISRWRQCTLSVQAYGQANTFSNQLGPVQAATALAAFEIVVSSEGDKLRRDVLQASRELREVITSRGLICFGIPSALVPVLTGLEVIGREAARQLGQNGILANFIEYPAVATGSSRLRLQVTPDHRDLPLREIGSKIADIILGVGGSIERTAVKAS
ncbi:aminotransferase class I/II-fold pyridoxal phosphate-dependent enzyme [Mesorhizobium sp. J428]|uniref:aminotransferase class I/II-fold pyridoxal phosphate-dependent enzyme n=1 Tax=Mesorhizobium sp. J428 TaxID=2898440 RepID=UPI0027E31380|nr:aminotransferase class I/II-fold pyridoxal phosphate-dependent enzyme [Mesorhizobium sp. J428]